MLSKNTEDEAEGYSASAYVLYLYESHRLYILNWRLVTWRVKQPLESGKVCCYWYQKKGASFSWFLGWLLQYKLLDYILVNIPRIAIWNVTAKWVTLVTGDPQVLREKYP